MRAELALETGARHDEAPGLIDLTSLSLMKTTARLAKTFVRAAAVLTVLAYVVVNPGNAQNTSDFRVGDREGIRKIELELADALDNQNKEAIDSLAKRIIDQDGAALWTLLPMMAQEKTVGPCEWAGILIRFMAIGLSDETVHGVKRSHHAATPQTVWELDKGLDVIIMAGINGLVRKKLVDKVLGLNGDLQVQPLEPPLTDWRDVADRISRVRGVRLAAPVVDGEALASSPSNVSGVLVRGIRAGDLNNLGSIAKNIWQGTLEGFDHGQGVVIGRGLADQLSRHAGDSVTLVAPRGTGTSMGAAPRIKSYKIAAVFEIGAPDYDSRFIFMSLPEAQAYFNRDNDVTAIEVFTTNPDRIDAFRALVTKAAGRPVSLVDWRQQYSTFFNAIEAERNITKDLLAKLGSVNSARLFAENMSMCELINHRGTRAKRRIGTDQDN